MDKLQRVREALADSDFFGSLTEPEIDRLVAAGTMVQLPAGRTIFQKGDPGDSLAVVVSGRVRIGTITPEGREAVLNFVEPGQTFGEMAMFDGKPRSADAVAIEPVGERISEPVAAEPAGFDLTAVIEALLRDGEVVASGPLSEALTAENLTATFGVEITLTHEAGRYAARAS